MTAWIENQTRFRTQSLKTWGSVALLILVGLLTYANNYQGEFIFDDFPAIIDNPAIQSLSSLDQLLRPVPDGSPLAGRPVPALTIALNYAFGGLDVRGYHFVNNLIHILASMALFGLIRATLLLPKYAPEYGGRTEGLALAVSLIWLVHPLNSEVVNYINCRTESLAGLFYLLTLYCSAVAFRAEQPQKWFAAALLACILGMASKEVMASAPLLVLLHDRLFVSGSFAEALRKRRWFYAALAATWLVVGFYQLDNPRAKSVLFDSAWISVSDYFLTQLTVIVHYIKLSIWPHPLVLDSQDWPIARGASLQVVFSFLAVAALGASTLFGLWRKAWWSILGTWFFCVLAPTSSVIPIVTEIVSERRMYLPLASIIILLVFTGDYLLQRITVRYPTYREGLRFVPSLTVVIIVLFLATMTYARNSDYSTAVSIWTDTVEKRPGNSRGQENLGKALVSAGKVAESIPPLQEAIRLYPKEQSKPELAELYSVLGASLAKTGNFSESVTMHLQAVALQPDDGLIHYHLGNAYLRTNDLANAEKAFRRSISLTPNFPPAHGNLALVLMQLGAFTEAEQHFQKLLELAPMEANSYILLAEFLISQNRMAEALRVYQSGIERVVNPDELLERRTLLLSSYPGIANPLQ